MGGTPSQPINKQSNNAASARARIPNTPGNKPVNTTNANRPGAAARPIGSKGVQTKAKKGFRVRPLDAALVLAGVLIVGFIVFSAFQAPPVQVNAGVGVPATATHVPVGNSAPDFAVQDVDGKSYNLSSFSGKVLVIEYMATWCPHCQEETPVYNQIYNTYVAAGKPVAMVGINATPYGYDHTSPATTNDLKYFKEHYGSVYPLLFDKALQSANDYGVISYPSVYIIDQQGKVAFQPPSDALPTYDQLAAKVDELLNAK